MKFRKGNLIYWLRTNSFELFPWHHSKGWAGFCRWLWFEICWYPAFCEQDMKPWESERRKRLVIMFHSRRMA